MEEFLRGFSLGCSVFLLLVDSGGALAHRLGDINKETAFVLEYFGVNEPPLLHDVHMRVYISAARLGHG